MSTKLEQMVANYRIPGASLVEDIYTHKAISANQAERTKNNAIAEKLGSLFASNDGDRVARFFPSDLLEALENADEELAKSATKTSLKTALQPVLKMPYVKDIQVLKFDRTVCTQQAFEVRAELIEAGIPISKYLLRDNINSPHSGHFIYIRLSLTKIFMQSCYLVDRDDPGSPGITLPETDLHIWFYPETEAYTLELRSDTPTCGWNDRYLPHPHWIGSTSPCLGDFAAPIHDAFQSGDLSSAIFLVLEYLQLFNPSDCAGAYGPWFDASVRCSKVYDSYKYNFHDVNEHSDGVYTYPSDYLERDEDGDPAEDAFGFYDNGYGKGLMIKAEFDANIKATAEYADKVTFLEINPTEISENAQ